jgi:hypothetical protein
MGSLRRRVEAYLARRYPFVSGTQSRYDWLIAPPAA